MSSLDIYYAGGPKTWQEAFPPICVKSHWDPTLLSYHVLPGSTQHTYAMDPRPSMRICTSYYNTSPGDAPLASLEKQSMLGLAPIPVSDVIPVGGAAGRGFAYEGYADNIQVEADLLRMNELLTKCSEHRYAPHALPAHTNVLPGASVSIGSTLSPFATEVKKQAGCREQDDKAAWNRSSRLFFNPTRYDRDPRMARIEGRNQASYVTCPLNN